MKNILAGLKSRATCQGPVARKSRATYQGLAVLLALLAGAVPAAAQKKPVTIDDVLNLKAVASAVVSPDGKQVLYTVRQWETDRDRMESRTRIWRVPVAGGAARQITFGERGDSQPQFSPDGRYISFVSARGPAATGEEAPRSQIYLMRADSGEAWKLTEAKEGIAANTNYAWSPDSRRIAFVSVDPRSSDQEAAIKKRDDERMFEGDFRYSHIWTIDVDSKETTRVTDGSAWTVRGSPSWAPDSKRLTFAANVTGMLRDYRSDVFIADTASKQIEKISTNPASDARARVVAGRQPHCLHVRSRDGETAGRRHLAIERRPQSSHPLRRRQEDARGCQ